VLLRRVGIKDRLKNEGYFTDTVTGPTLRTQLKAMIEAARSTRWKKRLSVHLSLVQGHRTPLT